MKRKNLALATAILLMCSLSFQSCIGSFSLTNKVLTWNKNVSNKFLNEIVFFAFWVLPVYEVTAAADLLVINSIEFWSGNKPLEANNKIIKTENGTYYINIHDNGYAIASPDGKNINFDFDKDSQTWSMNIDNGEKIDFLKFGEDNQVKIIGRDGIFVDVELTEDGVNKYIAGIGMPMMAHL